VSVGLQSLLVWLKALENHGYRTVALGKSENLSSMKDLGGGLS